MTVFVSAPYGDARAAQIAVDTLIESSFPPEEISVLVQEGDGSLSATSLRHTSAAPFTAVIGAVVGAILAVAAASFTVPEDPGALMRIIISAAFAGLFTGAGVGWWAGVYWWRNEVDLVADAALHGPIVVGITVPEGRTEEAWKALQGAGAERVSTSAASLRPQRPPKHRG